MGREVLEGLRVSQRPIIRENQQKDHIVFLFNRVCGPYKLKVERQMAGPFHVRCRKEDGMEEA